MLRQLRLHEGRFLTPGSHRRQVSGVPAPTISVSLLRSVPKLGSFLGCPDAATGSTCLNVIMGGCHISPGLPPSPLSVSEARLGWASRELWEGGVTWSLGLREGPRAGPMRQRQLCHGLCPPVSAMPLMPPCASTPVSPMCPPMPSHVPCVSPEFPCPPCSRVLMFLMCLPGPMCPHVPVSSCPPCVCCTVPCPTCFPYNPLCLPLCPHVPLCPLQGSSTVEMQLICGPVPGQCPQPRLGSTIWDRPGHTWLLYLPWAEMLCAWDFPAGTELSPLALGHRGRQSSPSQVPRRCQQAELTSGSP